MISTLNVRSDTHNSCEDSIFTIETDDYIHGIISDGCGTGKNSHFASQLICYCFTKVAGSKYERLFTSHFVISSVKELLLESKITLDLDIDNLLATCILFDYNKTTKTLQIRCLGDGYYSVNDVEYIIDQNNTPDYLSYHLYDDDSEFVTYLNKYPQLLYKDVEKFIICSDGIDKISRSSVQSNPKVDPNKLLFNSPVSKNYLERMWNLIKKDKWSLSDDLSIISYVS